MQEGQSLPNEYCNFEVQPYGNLEKVNNMISKCRLRIFYKEKNRNRSFINDEVSNYLINSLSYTPVKGIYDDDDGDYNAHGLNNNEGRIYGIVPENKNFAWEDHTDKNGVTRTYACTDVYLFTALYEEAKEIPYKAQSMELNKETLKWHMEDIDGDAYCVFDYAEFIGLQVLGDSAEPCFEGAAFYSYNIKTVKELVNYLKQVENNKGGNVDMVTEFKISFNEAQSAFTKALQEAQLECSNEQSCPVIMYDEYAIVCDYNTNKYFRVNYTKDDEAITLGECVEVFMVDMTADEIALLESFKCGKKDFEDDNNDNNNDDKAKEEGNKEEPKQADDKEGKKNNEKEAFSQNLINKIQELSSENSTLIREKQEIEKNYNEMQDAFKLKEEEITNLNKQLEELNQFKKQVESNEKEAVLAEYSEMLSKEELDSFAEKLDSFSTAIELDKELAYLVKTNGNFSFQNEEKHMPKDVEKQGIAAILDKYKNK